MEVETVRVLLERTFQMPVAESDAQLVLNRLQELGFTEGGPTPVAADKCPSCHGTGADPMSDNANWLPCQKCAGIRR